MDVAMQSAEEMLKVMIDGYEYTLRATGKITIELLKKIAEELKKEEGYLNRNGELSKLIEGNEQIAVYGINNGQVKEFNNIARKFGVVYYPIKGEEETDLIVRGYDAPKVERIFSKYLGKEQVNSKEKKEDSLSEKKSEEKNRKISELKTFSKSRDECKKSVKDKVHRLKSYTIEKHDLNRNLGR